MRCLKICRVLCPRTEKHLLLIKLKEVQVAVNTEGQKEITIFCLSFCYFCFAYCIDNIIFVGHSLIYVDRFGYL